MSYQIRETPGEIYDRMAILSVKMYKITDPEKLSCTIKRYTNLVADAIQLFSARSCSTNDTRPVIARLFQLHRTLWDVEDEIRDAEISDKRKIELIGLVHSLNSERHTLKQKIDSYFGSVSLEAKTY